MSSLEERSYCGFCQSYVTPHEVAGWTFDAEQVETIDGHPNPRKYKQAVLYACPECARAFLFLEFHSIDPEHGHLMSTTQLYPAPSVDIRQGVPSHLNAALNQAYEEVRAGLWESALLTCNGILKRVCDEHHAHHDLTILHSGILACFEFSDIAPGDWIRNIPTVYEATEGQETCITEKAVHMCVEYTEAVLLHLFVTKTRLGTPPPTQPMILESF